MPARTPAKSTRGKAPARTGKPAKSTSAGSSRAKGAARGAKATQPRPSAGPQWLLVLIIGAVLLGLAGWSYYPVARQQYISQRERDRLAAELAAVETRNANIQAEIDRLETPEGVEDYARSQLGWTKPGENAVVVTGIEGDSSSVGIEPRVDPQSVELTETPTSRFLDVIFGVK